MHPAVGILKCEVSNVGGPDPCIISAEQQSDCFDLTIMDGMLSRSWYSMLSLHACVVHLRNRSYF